MLHLIKTYLNSELNYEGEVYEENHEKDLMQKIGNSLQYGRYPSIGEMVSVIETMRALGMDDKDIGEVFKQKFGQVD